LPSIAAFFLLQRPMTSSRVYPYHPARGVSAGVSLPQVSAPRRSREAGTCSTDTQVKDGANLNLRKVRALNNCLVSSNLAWAVLVVKYCTAKFSQFET